MRCVVFCLVVGIGWLGVAIVAVAGTTPGRKMRLGMGDMITPSRVLPQNYPRTTYPFPSANVHEPEELEVRIRWGRCTPSQ